MTNRGRATVKKKDSSARYKDEWVNYKGEVVSPPSSPEPEKENRSKPKQPRKLSSEAPSPAKARQDSLNVEQSAARHDALAQLLFNNTNAQDHNSPVVSVEPRAPPAISSPTDSVLQERARPKKRAVRQSKSTTPPQGLGRPQESILKESRPVQQPTPVSHDSVSNPPPIRAANQFSNQPADTYDMANANNFIATGQFRHMRACMVCSIVKTEQQFTANGCPNCEVFLELAGDKERVQDLTSQVFEGLITVSDTHKSWVARWQRLEGYVPGVYAVQVEGVLPDEVIAQAEEHGVHYVPRDGSVNEALPTDA